MLLMGCDQCCYEREIDQRAVLWVAALALALPFLIATYRKLKALGMLLAELGVPASRAGRHTPKVRGREPGARCSTCFCSEIYRVRLGFIPKNNSSPH